MVHVVQQWFSHGTKANNLAVVQSLRLLSQQPQSAVPGELLVFSPCQFVKKLTATKWGTNRQKAKLPSPVSFYLSCHQKVSPTFRVGLPASNSLIKKIPHRGLCFCWFQMQLTNKMSHQTDQMATLVPILARRCCQCPRKPRYIPCNQGKLHGAPRGHQAEGVEGQCRLPAFRELGVRMPSLHKDCKCDGPKEEGVKGVL